MTEDLSTQQIIEFLNKNVLFQGTDLLKYSDNEDVKEAIKIIHISKAVPDDILFKKGEKGDFMVLLLEGELGVYVEGKSGNEVIVATVVQNSFVGEMAIIEEAPRMATVRATSGCLLGTIHSNDFWSYFKKSPAFSRNILRAINGRVREISANYINRLAKEKVELEREVQERTGQLREKDMQLLEMDRIAGTATLAAGIAHEINNPLSFVKSSIGFLKKGVDKMVGTAKYWDDKPVPEPLMKDYKEYLAQINFDYLTGSLEEKFERIKKGIDRIMKIVSSLKSFSRVDKEEIGLIDINNCIEEAIEVLSSQELVNVEFVKELQEVPEFKGYGNDINQCLLHTIKNAIDAVETSGKIKISTSYNDNDKQIVIIIIDDGKGMSPEVLRQAFNPFFTTKPVGSGTGVGLTIIERIVKRHGGKIELSSKENEGTTVRMMLSVAGSIE